MIPIHLSIQGLYSYQEKQEIDFRRLTEAQLFGIFGATGSGKSSILDAISYAVYGESERLNKRDNRSYNMMNLKSDRLFIDFIFAAGQKEEKQYRFTVHGKRHPKDFLNVNTPDRSAFEWKNDDWIPIDPDSAEEIIGLSYPNFRRTIIIPQGKFQEFLQLTETDRTRMLREIFSLDKYELFHKAASLERKNSEAVARHETLLQQLAHATPEAVKETGSAIATLEKEQQKLAQEIKKRESELKEMEGIRLLFEKIEGQTQELQRLEKAAPDMEKRDAQLQQYQNCLIDFKPRMDQRNEFVQTLGRIQTSLESKRDTRKQSADQLQTNEKTFASIREEYLHRETLLRKAEELDRILQLKEMERTLDAGRERTRKGEDFIVKTRDQIRDLREAISLTGKKAAEIKTRIPDLSRLLKIREWFGKNSALEKEIAQAEALLAEANAAMEALKEQKTGTLKTTSLDPVQYALPVEKLLQILSEEKNTLLQAREKAEEDRKHLSVRAQLSAYSESLAEGEPCPICGSTHHPDPLKAGDAGHQLTKAEARLQEIETAFRKAEKVLLNLEALQPQASRIGAEIQKRTLALQEARDRHDKLEATFVWEDFRPDDPEVADTRIAEVQELNAQVEALSREREVLEKSLEEEGKKLENYQQAVEKLKNDQRKTEVDYRAGVASLQHVSFDEFRLKENLEITEAAEMHRRNYKNISKLHEDSEKRIRQLRSNIDTLKGEIETLEAQQRETNDKLGRLNSQLNEALARSDFQALAEVEAILNLALNIDKEKKEIAEFRQQLHTVRASLADLRAQVSDQQFDAAKFEMIASEIATLQSRSGELAEQIGGKKGELDRLKKDLDQKKALQTELDRLYIRAGDIRTLKNLFSRSGFVNYVSTIYLQNLCLAANDRFMKLTQGSLRLEPTASNSFQVRDFLNDGQVRSVKTLSGGQTFQASLSLALALADQVQQQVKAKQNFFFIDEGFGSQDKSSLQIIFQTLKSLRKENRIVGVISHVEELQQEIDTYLNIVNDPERGSEVKTSWEPA